MRAISKFHIDDRKETKFYETSPPGENFQRTGSRGGCRRDVFAIVCKVLGDFHKEHNSSTLNEFSR